MVSLMKRAIPLPGRGSGRKVSVRQIISGLSMATCVERSERFEQRSQIVEVHTVADCVCLMALDKTDAVPIDTHVWQIAQRDYPACRAHGDFFRELWGPYAGWAQAVSLTFNAFLPHTKHKLSEPPIDSCNLIGPLHTPKRFFIQTCPDVRALGSH
uniref:Uncharacterized protein n=1 Tax=Eptatretus burgeri TaxID=7764 RepID=A0A8C4QVS3_EPTBU